MLVAAYQDLMKQMNFTALFYPVSITDTADINAVEPNCVYPDGTVRTAVQAVVVVMLLAGGAPLGHDPRCMLMQPSHHQAACKDDVWLLS